MCRSSLLPHCLFWMVIISIALLPDMHRWWVTPTGSWYPFVHKVHEDYYGYLSYMRQGREHWSLRYQYSTKPYPPLYLHNYYLLLGRIGSIVELSDVVMYRIGMYVPLILLYVFVYRMVLLVVPKRMTWMAMYLIFFSGPFPPWDLSFGGYTIPLGAEWWTGMDISNRLTMKPHHMVGTMLAVAGTYLLVRYMQRPSVWHIGYFGIFLWMSLIFFSMPGFLLLVTLSVCVSVWFLFFRKDLTVTQRDIPIFLVVVSISIVLLLFVQQESAKLNLVGWESARMNNHSESIFSLVYRFFLPFGVLSFFLIPGVVGIYKKRKFELWIFPLMVVVAGVLFVLSAKGVIALPAFRLMFFSPYVYAGIVALHGAHYVLNHIHHRIARNVYIGLCIGVCIANTYGDLSSYWWKEVRTVDVSLSTHIPQEYLDAIRFLDTHTPAYSHVMSTFYTGMFIPSFSHNTVYIGHEALEEFPTVWWYAKTFMAGGFSSDEAQSLLQKERISYVFWDQGKVPEVYRSFFKEVYTNRYVTIYDVTL